MAAATLAAALVVE